MTDSPADDGTAVRPVPFISRVRLKNYKSIASCDVRLDPLTILVGPNGSGKSNFLDALAFLARALLTTPAEALDERGGISEIVRRVPQIHDSFSIEIEVVLPAGVAGSVSRTGRYGFEIRSAPRGSARTFVVAWENCEPNWDLRARGWQANYGAVQAGADEPFAKVEADRLFLPFAGAQLPIGSFGAQPTATIPSPFTELYRGLSSMRFYNFDLYEMRRLQAQSSDTALGSKGEHLPEVLGALAENYLSYAERINTYLQVVVPNAVAIDRWQLGSYVTVMLRSQTGEGRDVVFGAEAMSDGTLRAAGVLAALFQPGVIDGQIPVIGIEEPEIALHPAAAGVLFDALTEASEHVQVLATSQSADLLDRDDLDVKIIRPVTMRDGLTIIGEVDDASREIAEKKLYTLGELMRGNQLAPKPTRTDGVAPEET